MIDFQTKPPTVILKTPVLDLNTNEIRISDYEVPTLEWLDKRLEDVNTEIDSVEKHLQHLK